MARNTAQRQAIRTVLAETNRPLRPQELLEEAQREVPNLGLATVYRAINDMIHEGWLVTVELPGRPTLYERATKGHHHYFHCRKCDLVYKTNQCPGGESVLIPDGFIPETHEVIIHGLCATCAAG